MPKIRYIKVYKLQEWNKKEPLPLYFPVNHIYCFSFDAPSISVSNVTPCLPQKAREITSLFNLAENWRNSIVLLNYALP